MIFDGKNHEIITQSPNNSYMKSSLAINILCYNVVCVKREKRAPFIINYFNPLNFSCVGINSFLSQYLKTFKL